MRTFFKVPKIDMSSTISKLKETVEHKYHDLRTQIDIALVKSKDLVKTNYELGLDHLKRGNLYDAGLRFKITLFLKPDHAMAYYQLGRTQLLKGNREQALKSLRKSLELMPDLPEAHYMLFTMGEAPPPPSIPLSIIEEYFDSLAATYNEEMLTNQHYSGHTSIVTALLPFASQHSGAVELLDLGCGTGLCGQALKEKHADCIITGVDISRSMLHYARDITINDVPIYDYLKHSDIAAYLNSIDKKYHIIISGLAFTYLGELSAILTQCKKALHDGGLLVFTVQKSDGTDWNYSSDMKNFHYSAEYLSSVARTSGYNEISITELLLYNNSLGLLCVFSV
jgi:predicted TPR repeat methyltransferase